MSEAFAMRDRVRIVAALLISAALIGLSLRSCMRTGSDRVPEVHVGDPVTDEECLELARKFEQAVNTDDFEGFARLFDWNALYQQAMTNDDIPEEVRQAVLKLAEDTREKRKLYARQFSDRLGDSGNCKFLRIHKEGGQKRLLVRLIHDDGGYTYHELLVARRPGGRILITDVYMHWQAERLTETMRRMLVLMADKTSTNALIKLMGSKANVIKYAPQWIGMMKAYRAGQFEETLRFYEQLPSGLQRDKNTLFLRLAAAEEVGDDEYLAAIEAIRTHLPDDACNKMISVGYFRLRKQFTHALEMVDQVEKAVGGDPYLHVVRAEIHFEAGDLDEARQHAVKAIEEEPELEKAYWIKVDVSLKEKRFDEVLGLLNSIEKMFGGDFEDFTKLPDYAEFVKSPQHEQWLKSRKK